MVFVRPFSYRDSPFGLNLIDPTGYHYQHSGDHGAIGLQLLASGQHECLQHSKSAAATRQSTPVHPTSPVGAGSQSPMSPARSPTAQSWHYTQSYSQQQQYSPSAYPTQTFGQQQRQYLGQQVPVQQPQY